MSVLFIKTRVTIEADGGNAQCGVKPLWLDEKFNVGDINVILRLDENKKIQTELRRARGEGKPGFLDPLRFDFKCDVF